MQRASSDSQYVFTEDQNLLLGAYLAADACSEHESGIRSLREDFGILREPYQFGMEHRKVTAVAGENILLEKRKGASLLLGSARTVWEYRHRQELDQREGKRKRSLKKIAESYGIRIWDDPEPNKVYGAWSERGFAIYAPLSEQSAFLKTIYNAFLDGDGIIMLGGGTDENPFRSPGLALGIISRMPDEIKQSMYDADKNSYELKEAAKATGIYDIVDRSKYFALTPRWYQPDPEVPEENRFQTEHPVIFWLNPYDQQNNGSGYFTVEDLTAWVRGEAPDGPIAGRGRIWDRKQRALRVIAGDGYELFNDEVCCSKCAEIINIGSGHYERTINIKYVQCPTCRSKEHLIPKARMAI